MIKPLYGTRPRCPNCGSLVVFMYNTDYENNRIEYKCKCQYRWWEDIDKEGE